MMTDEQRLKRWDHWIEIIQRDIWELFYLHHMFWEVQEIIKNNKRLSKTQNYFFEWLGEVFVYSSAMFVRRQADRRKDVISFYKLLDEINRHPGLLTREHFMKAWGYDERDTVFAYETNKIGEALFDGAVGVGKQCLILS